MIFRSHLKKNILFPDKGGREIQAGGIGWYFEDLKQAPDTDMGPKAFIETAFSTHPERASLGPVELIAYLKLAHYTNDFK